MTTTEIKAMLEAARNRDADYARACEISDRRMQALRANGEDTRNTIAWQDACYERSMISFRYNMGGGHVDCWQ